MRPQVYLGGSHGKVDWRRTLAAPVLDAAHISYASPLADGGDSLPTTSSLAKQYQADADVILFFLSGESRGVDMLMEAAYLLAAGRNLVLAVNDVPDGLFVGEYALTPPERAALNRGRWLLRMMAHEHGVKVFSRVQDALEYVVEWVQNNAA